MTAGVGMAYLVAVGIGLHNLGEGLAVSSAVATDEVPWAPRSTSASPPTTPPRAWPSRHRWGHRRHRHRCGTWCPGLVAGAPADVVPGREPSWVAAGAIVQVVWAVGRTLVSREPGMADPAAAGFGVGAVLMYLTALLTV